MLAGSRIRSLRMQKGISQMALAKETGIATITIRKYENGDRKPKIEQIYKIAKVLEVDPFMIITSEDYPDIVYKKNLEYTEPIFKYLDSIGYKFEYEREKFSLGSIEGEKGTSNIFLKAKNKTIKYTSEEFEQFKQKIKDSVDYLIWQQQNKQQKPPSDDSENGSN